MPVSYKVLTPPASEPIALSDAKDYLNIDFSDKDALITRLMGNARRYAEKLLRRSLATQTIQAVLEFDHVASGDISGPVDVPYDTWRLAERPDIPLFGNALVRLQVPMGPVQTLTSVEYQLTRMDSPEWTLLTTPDSNGNDTYRIDSYAEPNEVNVFTVLAATRFRLTYVAGASAMPYDIRSALKRCIAFLYDNREAAIDDAIDREFASRRVFTL